MTYLPSFMLSGKLGLIHLANKAAAMMIIQIGVVRLRMGGA